MHRRWLSLSAAAALIVVSLAVALLPDHKAGTGHATPAAATRSRSRSV